MSGLNGAEPRMRRPRALRPGARIAIVSPASAVNPDRVALGMERLALLGYEPVLARHALRTGPVTFAGTVAERVADLHAAFADPTIDALCCTRGGWGTAELLPYLDLDLIRANPKPFLGYSDHTSLHTVMAQETGLVTFYAPMISPDFARGSEGLEGVDVRSFQAALTQEAPWEVGAEEGLRVLRPALDGAHGGRIEGRLWGGCLAILAESLGTRYAPRPCSGSVLFLEDVSTKPYQWDRMLLHLRYAGCLDGVQAIVFGDMRQCVPEREDAALEAALLHSLREFQGPLFIGLRCGHVDAPNVTLPLGVRVAVETEPRPRLEFLDAAVSLTGEAEREL